jgi:adenosylcobinamide-GDP ribazoletransferase
MKGWVTAFRTLTVVPMPGRDTDDFASALPYFPLVGAFLGTLVAGVAWLATAMLGWPMGAGALGTALAALLTRGLHLDGLADVADAVGGGRTRERRLQIMKDPHVGAFGVTAIVLALLLKAAAISEMAGPLQQFVWILIPFIVSRAVIVELAVLLPYARGEGGTAGPFVRTARPCHLAAAVILAAALGYAAAGAGALVVLAGAFAFGLALTAWMKIAFGGVTGDLLGMASELTETLTFIILAVASPFLNAAR